MRAITGKERLRTLLRAPRTLIRTPVNWIVNRLDPPVAILLYHRVTELPSDPQMLAVTPERFRAHMRYLSARHPIVRLEEPWGRTSKPCVAVTFDDGYADNALEALPILEETGVPATFFVTTGNVESRREFWWDDLERMILGEASVPERFDLDDATGRRSWPTRTREERERLYHEIHPKAKRVKPETREQWLAALRRWAGVPEAARPAFRPMTVDEVRGLDASRCARVGAHGHTHTPLAALSSAEQREEMLGSKGLLTKWLGREVDTFSFPFGGARDFSRESVAIARDAGFRRVVANRPGQVHRWTDPHALPRFLVRDWDLDQFTRSLARFFVA